LIFGYVGAAVNATVSANHLNIILGCIIVFAGIYALFPARGGTITYEPGNTLQKLLLLGIGSAVGFGSGLTGVGGPVLSVPIMVIAGFHPLTAIATSQVIQITAATSGTIGNIANSFVDFTTASWVTAVELVGVFIGARLAHTLSTAKLKKAVSVVCIVVGAFILIRSAI